MKFKKRPSKENFSRRSEKKGNDFWGPNVFSLWDKRTGPGEVHGRPLNFGKKYLNFNMRINFSYEAKEIFIKGIGSRDKRYRKGRR